ncbi:MAG: glutamate--tRNA ligase [Bdellovibrionales bacterium RIFOXYD12_FULL_39_22]|nr:MAG: glutamate--tRNA ligase [Bdellovibrionales bacterium RIFOXYB1_FULL_39_21]OFZ42712.1 MAG: glutamate--tRNA ligase [Bdellovibrionales bacterium RIFOXYC12_FULL_39_17]OFZ47271.1 MAG: glutamate--tRNA ligase [Bdellovibrionales bacterium RIFOXYC1_FULL_39_130]OFZ73469.1 MAG: glutamate--tRNA ligase [Bdellovibrionales bacterium RIFOXYC2_FULL_39_8]OFZ75437.1 MAG: glutamate--tRNA ligase [Bdellovibrionales bacterium RIFOXYD1_FULL_39_84]OFZ93391.1 MAG: glutamate--tRNA ligase [Bdellovibrionales bacteri
MSIKPRVRFAPSPTGFLHIGGARTALYNYLFAKAYGGTNILRIEDTDLGRSTPEYEQNVINELKWLGIEYDESPERPGEVGPYRQSDRLHIYKKYALDLVEQGKAFYCFCTDEELEAKRQYAADNNLAPHYDGTCKKFSKKEVEEKLAKGEKGAIRFSVPSRSYTFNDFVRGEVTFESGVVGDFVIIRANGLPIYNYGCVIDDWQMKITHVLRAEDHLPNTVRQLMLYEAFGVTPPIFGHLSLLIGNDRQKLSKRHGATSVTQYRESSYLPEAMNNYLCLLGWSHPNETDIFTKEEVTKHFTLDRFTKSPAVFDLEKFRWVNGQHLRGLDGITLHQEASKFINKDSPYHAQNEVWQKEFLDLFKIKVDFFNEYNAHATDIFNPTRQENEGLKEIYGWESTATIAKFVKDEAEKLIGQGISFLNAEQFKSWEDHLKIEKKIKGKFLFKGLRGVITGKDEGPDLHRLALLTPLKIISGRIDL